MIRREPNHRLLSTAYPTRNVGYVPRSVIRDEPSLEKSMPVPASHRLTVLMSVLEACAAQCQCLRPTA
ncbi:hypothetical protein HBI51_247440 [Parastagonospora nodorum]|nr:hypothetical protein HBI51_247440 [Parastagonospora nodorum]